MKPIVNKAPVPQTTWILQRYFALLYVALLAMIALFWPLVSFDSPPARVFAFAASAGYAALYLAPVVMLSALLGLCLRQPSRTRHFLVVGVAFLGGCLALLAIYADYRLYALYEYHFNGFVWNLLTTPGGIAALGATEATEQTIAGQVAMFVAGNAAVMGLLHYFAGRGPVWSKRAVAYAVSVALLVLVSEEIIFAYSVHTGQEDLLEAADVVPFHLGTGAKKLFTRLGIERTALKERRLAGGTVDYPGGQLVSAKVKGDMNVIMLVAESFRWDLLDPEITPNLWKFSQRAQRFENHYSGGNRTRMGLFSMFYGIYAPYWYSFEQQRVAPALMNFMRQHDYQLALHTSQSFDYPELRNTLFTGVPEQYMQELKTGEPWRRDIQNVSDIIGKLDKRAPDKPFFGFMFFESTHAPYSFPEKDVVREDYLREMNYVKLNLRDNIDGIHARYINAAHHIDREVGRLIEHLERTGMLDKTVLMFSGDHGEEFMEKGRWGHGHSNTFPEEQVRVPLVLWMPGTAPAVVTHRTSHLQIAPTLLSYLGVTQPARSYSSADTLDKTMPYFVFGEYDHMGIFDGKHKITFPYTGTDFFRYSVFDANDHPVARDVRQVVVSGATALLDEITRESRRFVR